MWRSAPSFTFETLFRNTLFESSKHSSAHFLRFWKRVLSNYFYCIYFRGIYRVLIDTLSEANKSTFVIMRMIF